MSDTPQNSPDNSESSVDPNSVEGLFVVALGKATPEERNAFLDEACGEDKEQRMRVEALLRAYDDAGSFMEKPAEGLPTLDDPLKFDFLETSDDPSLLGTLGPYEIYEVIGRGGMGIVFRARDPKLNRVVAVKVLAPELAANPNARRRFVREAQAGASISHPHVVTIHAVDDDANLPYLVMECIVGQSLQQKLDKVGSLRLTEVLRISKQISEGLTAAHKQGLIHRDIKPANILLENGVERVKITDFGLARAVDDVSVTRTGEVAGSPQFMSPEQAKGERVDHRSDLFSLGCVMYAMCTGRSPFRATSIAAAIRRVCDDTPRPIEEINPEVPDWMIGIIENLLDKDADARFQSAVEVEEVLGSHLAGIQGTGPKPTNTPRPKRPSPTTHLAQNIVSLNEASPWFNLFISALACVVGFAVIVNTPQVFDAILGRSGPLVAIIIFVILSIRVGLRFVKKLKLHADAPSSEHEPTQAYSPSVASRPLLEQFHSAFMRLALMGPIILLIGACVLAYEPELISSENAESMIFALTPGIWIAGIMAWMGMAIHRVKWGNEAYYKGILASFLAILCPPVWIVGIPTGLAVLWTLNNKAVSNLYMTKGEAPSVELPKPWMLLDLGTFIGAGLSMVILLFLGQDYSFTRVDVLEAAIPMGILMALTLPFRGELFRGRGLRDIGICVLATGIACAVYSMSRNPEFTRIGPAEWLVMISMIFFTFGIPLSLLYFLVIQPRMKNSPAEQVPVVEDPNRVLHSEPQFSATPTPGTKSAAQSKSSLVKRLLFGALLIASTCFIFYKPPLQQAAVSVTGDLVIYHRGDLKPVVVTVDGKTWQSYATKSDTISYYSLPPGEHQIQVRLLSQTGHETEQNFTVEIKPQQIEHIAINVASEAEPGAAAIGNGGLILEIPDPELNVLLEYTDTFVPSYYRDSLKAGEHKIPVGKYRVYAHDFLVGWLHDVAEPPGFFGGPFHGVIHRQVTNGFGEISASITQTDLDNIEFKPGEYATLTVKRDWQALAEGAPEFEDGKFYRFLWNGKTYSLSANQARVVDVLLNAYAKRQYHLLEKTILDKVIGDSDGRVGLATIFNGGRHPAWENLVMPASHDFFRLSPADVPMELPPGMQIGTFTLDITSHKGLFLPGDHCDLLMTYRDGEKSKTKTLFEYVQMFDREKKHKNYMQDFSFILTPHQAEVLESAKQRGYLSIHWRVHVEDPTSVTPMTNEELVETLKTLPLLEDTTSSTEMTSNFEAADGSTVMPTESVETGAVIVNREDRSLRPYASLGELGTEISLGGGTKTLPVGTYLLTVRDYEFGWRNRNEVLSTYAALDYGTFEIKKGEFVNLNVKRDWKKLAEQEPVEADGFYSFQWFASNYILSKRQSEVVHQLLKSFAAKKVLLKPAELVDGEQPLEELKTIFNNGIHPAGGELIEVVDDEFVRLKWKDSAHNVQVVPGGQNFFPIASNYPDDVIGLIGRGQSLDILVKLEGQDEPQVLVLNTKVIHQLPNKDHRAVMLVSLTQEQKVAVTIAKARGTISFRWGDISNEAPDPKLNQRTFETLKLLADGKSKDSVLEILRQTRAKTLKLHGPTHPLVKEIDAQIKEIEQPEQDLGPVTEKSEKLTDPKPVPESENINDD